MPLLPKWSLPGGAQGVCVFIFVLVAYTVQTEAIKYVQHFAGYNKPLLLLYVTHSSFIALLPAYLFVLWLTGRYPAGVTTTLKRKISLHANILGRRLGITHSPLSGAERSYIMTGMIVILTVGLTVPSLSWFFAVPFTSMGCITSIYNTFSIWAMLLAVFVLGESWGIRDAVAVICACVGVTLVAFGSPNGSTTNAPFAIIGNPLALLGAISMAGYEIVYRIIAVFDEDEQGVAYAPLSREEEEESQSSVYYPKLPFGLYAITMTTGIGLSTLALFWIPLLAAHLCGFETIELPTNTSTCVVIGISIMCGVLFNGAFTVLLSLWGPVLASVSCLLTTVFVQIADMALGMPVTWMSIFGCSIVTAGFACLVWS